MSIERVYPEELQSRQLYRIEIQSAGIAGEFTSEFLGFEMRYDGLKDAVFGNGIRLTVFKTPARAAWSAIPVPCPSLLYPSLEQVRPSAIFTKDEIKLATVPSFIAKELRDLMKRAEILDLIGMLNDELANDETLIQAIRVEVIKARYRISFENETPESVTVCIQRDESYAKS